MSRKDNVTSNTKPPKKAASPHRGNREINALIDKSWKEAITGFQFIKNPVNTKK